MKRRADSPLQSSWWPPIGTAAIGAALGFALAAIVHWGLQHMGLVGTDSNEPVFAVFVTASAAGGAAALTVASVKMRASASRREVRALFDEQFQRGAELLGGSTESSVVAGSSMLAAVFRDSPEHAQSCADLLCTALRRPLLVDRGSISVPAGVDAGAVATDADLRSRTAIHAAIQRCARSDKPGSHGRTVRWDFSDARFGCEVRFSGCSFGSGTTFVRTNMPFGASLAGASFAGNLEVSMVNSGSHLDLGGTSINGWLNIEHCSIGTDDDAIGLGLTLDEVSAEGVHLAVIRTNSKISANDCTIFGDLEIVDAEALNVDVIGAKISGALRISGVVAENYLCVRESRVRKWVVVEEVSAAREYERRENTIGGELVERGIDAPVVDTD